VGHVQLQRPSYRRSIRDVRWQPTERDEEILRWIARHGVVSPEQIARRFFPRDDGGVALSAMYVRIRKLEELQLLKRHPPIWFKGPKLVHVMRVGAQIADVGLAPPSISHNSITLRHALAVVDLTEDLLRQFPGAELTTEAEMRRDHRRVPRDERRPVSRFPDAILTFPDGRKVSVELDLSRKGPPRTREKIQAYSWQPGVHVWWFCAAPDIYREVVRAVQAEAADDIIEVRMWHR
jgi:hypothetical protein